MSEDLQIDGLKVEIEGDEVTLWAHGKCSECGAPARAQVRMSAGRFRDFAGLALDAVRQRA